MKMPVHPFRDFFQRAKEKRDITKAEKMASEFQGCDVFMGGAGNDTIEQLCAIGPSALPSLLSILISSKPVRITDDLLASISLMRTPETLSMLLATLSSQDNPLRGSACIVLGFWKEKSAVEALASIALDASEPMPIRINAVHSLGRIGDSSATAPLLSLVTPYECSLATRNAPVLISTNYSPSKHGDVDGKGGDELIQACIEALAELGDRSAITRLRELAQPSSPYRCDAIVAFAELGDIESVPLMVEMAGSKEKASFNAAAKALCIISDPRGAAPLAELLRTKTHISELLCKMQIIRTLGELGDPCAIPVLFSFIKSKWGSESETKEAIASLAKFKCDEAYSLLVDLIHKSDSKVSKDIMSAIMGIGAPAVQFLIPKLDSDKWSTPATLLADMGYGITAVNHYRKLTIQKPEMRFEFDARAYHVMCQMNSRKMLLLKAQKIDFSTMPLKRSFLPSGIRAQHGASPGQAKVLMQ